LIECLGVHLLSMKSQTYRWPGDVGHVADEAVSSSQHQPSCECRVISSTSALVLLVILHPLQSFLFRRITHSRCLPTFYHCSGLLLQSLESVSCPEVRRKRREIVKKKNCVSLARTWSIPTMQPNERGSHGVKCEQSSCSTCTVQGTDAVGSTFDCSIPHGPPPTVNLREFRSAATSSCVPPAAAGCSCVLLDEDAEDGHRCWRSSMTISLSKLPNFTC